MTKSDKLTGQQEIFCLEYVRTGVASAAYRVAYKPKESTKPQTVWSEASRLMADPKVSARIKELWALAADVTIGEVVTGFRQARDIGLEERSASGVTGAVMGLARVGGHLKDDGDKSTEIHLHIESNMARLG